MRWPWLAVMCFALAWGVVCPPLAQAGDVTCHVKYLSAEHIYLDAGSAQQLTAGLVGQVVREGKTIAELKLVFVAERSATAQAHNSVAPVMAGDRVVFAMAETAATAVDSMATLAPTVTPSRTRKRSQVSGARRSVSGPQWRGSVAIQWDHATETNDRKLQTDILRLPVRVEAKNVIWGATFRARASFRRYHRAGYSSNTPAQEWRNRIYEVALVGEDQTHTWHYAVGRVGSRASSGAGSFDGARVSRRLGAGSRFGLFGGFAPQWGDFGFGTDDHLLGLDYRYSKRSGQGRSFDLLWAGIGRYRSGEISREYMSLTTNWRVSAGLSFLQAAEVDFNRGWRHENGARAIVLSSFALGGRYQVLPQIGARFGYDNREPVRTWETRSLPDSLFQGAGRKGLRAGLRLRPGYRMSLHISASTRRDNRTNDKVNAWRVRWNAPQLVAKHTTVFAALRGFDGPLISGFAPSLGVSQSWSMGLTGRVETGQYNYTGSLDGTTRENSWLMVGLSKKVAYNFLVSADYRQDWGDDIVGSRWFVELRRSF